MSVRFQVTFDAADPEGLAAFWETALGYERQDPPEGYATWEEWAAGVGIPKERWNDFAARVDPDGVRPRLFFQRVPEPKTVKNRVHLDVNVSGDRSVPRAERRRQVDAEVERLVRAGAKRLKVNEEYAYHDPGR